MKIVNLTGHPIKFVDDNGKVIHALSIQEQAANSQVSLKEVDRIAGLPVVVAVSDGIKHLPPEEPDTIYLANWAVVSALRATRKDVFIPALKTDEPHTFRGLTRGDDVVLKD